jgi:ATP-dependent RNA helicase RhlE
VINFDMPDTTDAYTHRIGRTGRVNNTGEAFTLVTAEDKPMVLALERIFKKPIEQRILPGFNYSSEAPEKPERTNGRSSQRRRAKPLNNVKSSPGQSRGRTRARSQKIGSKQ